MRTQVVITLDFDSDDVSYEEVETSLQELLEDGSLSYELFSVKPD